MRIGKINQEYVEELGKAVAYFESAEYEVDGPEKKLHQNLLTCSNDLHSIENSLMICETASISRMDKIKEQEDQLENCAQEKIAQVQEIINIKFLVTSKDIEIMGFKVRMEDLENKLKHLESGLAVVKARLLEEQASLKICREQVRKEQLQNLESERQKRIASAREQNQNQGMHCI
jgi:hypothetical protein